ncbi:MAG: hypothetical protein IRD7MM_04380 [Candidatus Midichloria mitochondrii]|uniref:DUF4153 domain-containing protein n=1 Tax=Candidatus Midichloria mitochondrii TaxID=234827 RepID=UPI0002FEE97A|nr:DUF4153 domain-containing protein [Candidatus Midichloria mitochondrii]
MLHLGLAAIIASLGFLFGVKFYRAIYEDVWLVVVTLFLPISAMAGITQQFDTIEEPYPKAIRIILSHITPLLLLIYAVILYCYAIKIPITWGICQKAGVAYLVSAFGRAGVVAY